MACTLVVAAPAVATAQQPAVDSLRAELERLRARVDSLEQVVARLRSSGQDTTAAASELEALRAAAAAAAGGVEQARPDTAEQGPPQFVGRQRSQQALNPEITATGDIFGLLDMDAPNEQSFVAREFEFSFQAALDPYSLAKIFAGYHVPGGEITPFLDPGAEPESAELAVEEGYLQWRGLPGGLNVTLGRFRQNFGTLNRWHPHALPGQSYPLPYLAFFGEEGLAQSGVGVHWLAPFTGVGAWEVWTELTAGENEALFGGASKLSVLGRVNGFFDLSRSVYFELGGNYLTGPSQDGADALATRVAGADFTLSWRPPERSRYREATLRGGVIWGELAPGGVGPGRAVGAFANAEYRLGQRVLIGGRYGYTENPMDPAESTWLAAPTLTWWQSEWVRLRLEYDYLNRPDGSQRLLVLQTTFAMGPHKHENY